MSTGIEVLIAAVGGVVGGMLFQWLRSRHNGTTLMEIHIPADWSREQIQALFHWLSR